MKRLAIYSVKTRVVVLTVLLLGGVIGCFTMSTAEAETQQAGERRLLTIHDHDIEKGVLTEKSTLREALQEANIRIDPNDITEPSLDEKLVSTQYQVNIYRARPVVIVDGVVRTKIISPYRTAAQIVEQAGLTLHDEDKAELAKPDDMLTGGPVETLTLERATPFVFIFYGKRIESYTQANTVGEMLRTKKITPQKEDTLSVAQNTPITSNMVVELWHNGLQMMTQEEEIDFPIEKIKDANREIGYREIQTPGVKGKKNVTYEVVMKNGKEESRKELGSIVTKEPLKQVEIVGVKVNLPPGSHEDWMAVAGIASSDYGYVNYIVMREGGWEPCKVQGGAINCEYSDSMGYGIVQATPGRKMVSAGSDWRTNPITQLRWATSYAAGRYGSWAAAYEYWVQHHNW